VQSSSDIRNNCRSLYSWWTCSCMAYISRS